MTAAGWAMMISSWTLIIGFSAFLLYKTIFSGDRKD